MATIPTPGSAHAPSSILTLEEGDNLLHGPEATHALEGGEGDGHLGLVVGIGVVLRELGVELRCQLLQRGERSWLTSPGTRGPPGWPCGALPTLLGCAWTDRAVLTDSTLNRKGRCPWKASFTLAPRQAGLSAIHWPRVFWGMRLSRMRASPRGCVPIHSCETPTETERRHPEPGSQHG